MDKTLKAKQMLKLKKKTFLFLMLKLKKCCFVNAVNNGILENAKALNMFNGFHWILQQYI